MPDFVCAQIRNVDKVSEDESAVRVSLGLTAWNHVATYKQTKNITSEIFYFNFMLRLNNYSTFHMLLCSIK
jgi:hypothetical protein